MQQPGILSAPTPIDRASTRIVARMAANMSFRIQITSFAAQTSAALGLRKEVQSAVATALRRG
jgi:hypothetical protein